MSTRDAAAPAGEAGPPPATGEARHRYFRRLERRWQEDVGRHLLDVPHDAAGTARLFAAQFERVIDCLDLDRPGVVVEIGCGKGHFLAQADRTAARRPGPRPTFVGIDLSRAVQELPGRGLAGIRADGEALPFADGSLSAVIYDGALHHLIDYEAGLRDAWRALAPGGRIVIFEPVSSPFSRLVHRLLDPLVFRKLVYESPIDQEYKHAFREDRVATTLRALGMPFRLTRTDALAYPLTGCYAGSAFGRSLRFMGAVMALERVAERIPGVRRLLQVVSWRFLVVASKPGPPPARPAPRP